MSKLNKIIVAVAVTAALFSGCKTASPPSASESPQLTQTQSPAPTPSPTPVETAAQVQASAQPQPEAADISSLTFNNPAAEFIPVGYTAETAPYHVEPDLSNVLNISRFPALTPEQRAMLAQNYFVVTPTDKGQMSYIYDENMYRDVPSFITADSVLQVYHVFYDYALRTAEEKAFLPVLADLTSNMLSETLSRYSKSSDGGVKADLEYAAAYFGVTARLLSIPLPGDMPPQSLGICEAELKLISAADGYADSPLTGGKTLYGNFKPRGHYTRSEELTRYFSAMMWYGTIPFNLYNGDGSPDYNMAAKAMLIADILFGLDKKSGFELWESIYSPTTFFVGESDDLTPYDIYSAMNSAAEGAYSTALIYDEAFIGRFYRELEKLAGPLIVNEIEDMNGGVQFRFMGQRYIPDSEILQKLSKPILRPMPSGLDVFAVLGSARAEYNIDTYLKPEENWPEYRAEYDKIKSKFDSLPGDTWRSNMYYGWLWSLLPLNEPVGGGWPPFMQNDAWRDKSLASALGSWAMLRHDTVLYSKPSGAEMGGYFPEEPIGYVEPCISVYERLRWLVLYSKEQLLTRGMLDEYVAAKADAFTELLDFLISCSMKELRNEPLSEDDMVRIISYGGLLESLSVSIMTSGEVSRWFEIESITDRCMAAVVDVHNTTFASLEAAVGTPAEIYVIIPYNGELYLSRGAVYDYFEFASETKLSDEEWQEIVFNGEAPERPEWVSTFLDLTGIGAEIPFKTETGY